MPPSPVQCRSDGSSQTQPRSFDVSRHGPDVGVTAVIDGDEALDEPLVEAFPVGFIPTQAGDHVLHVTAKRVRDSRGRYERLDGGGPERVVSHEQPRRLRKLAAGLARETMTSEKLDRAAAIAVARYDRSGDRLD